MTGELKHYPRAAFALLLAGVLTTACSVNDREHKPFQPQGQGRLPDPSLPGRNYPVLYPAISSVDPALRRQKKQAVMQIIRGMSVADARAKLSTRGFRCSNNRCSYGRIRQHEHDGDRVYITENTVIEMRPSPALTDDDVSVQFAVLSFRQPD